MIDESTNISIQKKLSICVRYVVNGESQTEFLANVKIDNGYAHTIVRHLVAKLESLNIDKGKMVSLASMFGRKTGVGVQIKSKYSPFLVQTRCIAHRLNLACADAIKKTSPFSKYSERNLEIYIGCSVTQVIILKS